jgi:hypothetical protein
MRYINECWEDYNRTLPEDWLENSGFDGGPGDEELLLSKTEELIFFSRRCVDKLSRSILSGEYVENTNEAKEKLKGFLQHLYHSCSDINSIFLKKLIDKTQVFYNSFSKCINRYLDLIYLFEDKYENASISSVFKSSAEIPNDEMFDAFRYFVEWVEPLCRLDYTLSFKESSIGELFFIKQTISLNSGNEYLSIDLTEALLDKVSFLLLKLQHVRNRPSIIYYDSCRYEVNTTRLRRPKMNEWEKLFYALHKEEDRIAYMDTNLESLERRLEDHSITIPELIVLMKHYQKSDNRTTDIDKVISHYDNYIRHSASIPIFSYNKLCLRLLKSYLHNSKLSYQLSHGKFSLSELNAFYSEIDGEQDSFKIKNFHPYEKILSYLSKHYLSKIDSIDSNDYTEALVLYDKCLKSYSESIEWGLKNDFCPFLLPFADSMIFYSDNLKVFYPSSFTRPLRYEKLKDELSGIVRNYDMYKAQKFLIDERKSIVAVKKEIEDTKKESLKILGIFSTVVTFLFGTIDVFAKTKDFKETLLTSLGVGTVLFLFCTLIYLFLLSEDDYKNKPVKFYSILFIALISAMVLGAFSGTIK